MDRVNKEDTKIFGDTYDRLQSNVDVQVSIIADLIIMPRDGTDRYLQAMEYLKQLTVAMVFKIHDENILINLANEIKKSLDLVVPIGNQDTIDEFTRKLSALSDIWDRFFNAEKLGRVTVPEIDPEADLSWLLQHYQDKATSLEGIWEPAAIIAKSYARAYARRLQALIDVGGLYHEKVLLHDFLVPYEQRLDEALERGSEEDIHNAYYVVYNLRDAYEDVYGNIVDLPYHKYDREIYKYVEAEIDVHNTGYDGVIMLRYNRRATIWREQFGLYSKQLYKARYDLLKEQAELAEDDANMDRTQVGRSLVLNQMTQIYKRNHLPPLSNENLEAGRAELESLIPEAGFMSPYYTWLLTNMYEYQTWLYEANKLLASNK